MRWFAPLLAALALAACGSDSAPVEPAADESPIPIEPDGGIGDGAGPPEALKEALANRIPTRFHGVWDYIEGSCARESDMRTEISSSEMLFYESVGTVTAVTDEGGDVVVTLAMEGEGETWEEMIRLSLTGEGPDQRLETSDGAMTKVTDEYPSKRCE